MSTMSLTEKVILVHLTVTRWTARKRDKAISQEINLQKGVDAGMGRYYKDLLKSSALDDYSRLSGEVRTYFYSVTLPWHYDGAALLPVDLYDAFTKRMAAYKQQADDLAAKFVATYDEAREAARENLGTAFDARDYPPAATIARKFSMSVNFQPLADPNDLRIKLSDDEVTSLRSSMSETIESSVLTAMRSTWERLHTSVSRMAEKLSTEDAIFRDSLVGNLSDLLDLLPKLNVTGDKRMDVLVAEARDKLCRHEPDVLREDAAVRSEVAGDAASILSTIEQYVGKIDMSDEDRAHYSASESSSEPASKKPASKKPASTSAKKKK